MNNNAILLGVSLKTYFSYAQTLAWSQKVAQIARQHPAIVAGDVRLFVLPAFPAIPAVVDIFAATPVQVGAQDLAGTENGAWTGEVSGSMLAEIGCCLAEVGHAERRRYFAEDDTQIAAKLAMALRHGMTPILCLGEPVHTSVAQAVALCTQQYHAALAMARQQGLSGAVIIAWEPQWAIGAANPAPDDYIQAVCAGLRDLAADRDFRLSVIYGGSAGPGLLQRLNGQVNGLFLGRFAHDPAALRKIIDDAAAFDFFFPGRAR